MSIVNNQYRIDVKYTAVKHKIQLKMNEIVRWSITAKD